MSRPSQTIQDLAEELGVDVDLIKSELTRRGLKVTTANHNIYRPYIRYVRTLLGLPPTRTRIDVSSVEHLASRAGLKVEEARDRLFKGGVLAKRRLRRIPQHSLSKAEEILGLLQVPCPGPEAPIAPVVKPRRKPKPEWPTIGPEQSMIYINPGDVEQIHWVLVKDFAKSKDPIVPAGLRDQTLLASAVHRQRTALGETDKYPTVAMSAASLLYGIVLDHPFHNGNKRTAIVATVVFFDKNGWMISCNQDDIYELLLQMAGHELKDRDNELLVGPDNEVLHVAKWLQSRIRRVSHLEHPRQFRQLRHILESYGCVFEHREGNRMHIRRGRLQTQVHYQRDGADVKINSIRKIRKDLELDETHGYDSDIFYHMGTKIPEFINKYRKLLDRLAKV